MSLFFCSKCSAPRSMDITITEQEITGPDEEPIKVETETYHCSTCHSFVRSTSIHKQPGDQGDGEQAESVKA